MLPTSDDPRFRELGPEGFRFACHPGVPCFNECCRRLNLVLTPYDVLRLKSRLGLTSSEFIDRYTEVQPGQNGWPLPRLKMSEDAEGLCPFVTPEGCSVYEDRPGACRTYPLGRATQGGDTCSASGPVQETYFLVAEEHCRGFEEGTVWTPGTWTADQGLETYNIQNDMFLPLITRRPRVASIAEAEKKMKMFFMACYNLEAFRKFVTQSGLAARFDIPPARLEALASNDLQLLRFAFDWLRFSLFGDPTLALGQEAETAARLRLEEEKKRLERERWESMTGD